MFSCLKKVEVKKALKKREINKLIKLAESQASINGLTSSHKYSIVKNAIQQLKEQGVEPTIKLKKALLSSSKAWLSDCIEYKKRQIK
jgi:hypothetical protein